MIRRINFLRIFALAVYTIIFNVLLHGQSFSVKHYSIKDGIPGPAVLDAVQDSSGIMWFASRKSVFSYDGYEWKTFNPGAGIPQTPYIKLKLDSKGIIWALPGAANKNIVYYDGYRWHSLPVVESVNAIQNVSFDVFYENNSPVIAVGTYGGGLFLYRNKKWEIINKDAGLPSNRVNQVKKIGSKLYLMTMKGIAVLEDLKYVKALLNIRGLPGKKIFSAYFGSKDGDNASDSLFWLMGENWIGYVQNKKFYLISSKLNLPFTRSGSDTYFLTGGFRDIIFFGNGNALLYLNKDTGEIKSFNQKSEQFSGGATSVFVDREKDVWITTLRGIDKVKASPFVNYNKNTGLLEDEVTAIDWFNNGTMVLGHNDGFSIKSGNSFYKLKFPPYSGVSSPITRILDMAKDKDGNIWFAAAQRGFGKLTPQRKIVWIAKPGVISYYSVAVDKNNRIWVASDNGLSIMRDDKLIPFKSIDLTGYTMRKIAVLKDSSLAICTSNGGLILWKDKNARIFKSDNSEGNSVYSVFEDEKGRIFAGCFNGLYIVSGNELIKYQDKDFSISRPVYFINERNGIYWFGLDNGVIKYSAKGYRTYTYIDGLAGYETNRAAGKFDSKGRFWIGMDNGLSCYISSYNSYNNIKPLAKILFLTDSFGKHYSLNNKLNLNYDRNSVIINYIGISFLDDGKINYKVTIKNLSGGWSDSYYTLDRNARFSNLNPGSYIFSLRAENVNGVWSNTIYSAVFKIGNPFYRTWWFIFLNLIVIGLIFYSIQTYFSQRKYSANLEKEVKLRTVSLARSEKKYKMLLETAGDAIIISDAAGGKIIDVNLRTIVLTGIPHDKIIGSSLFDLLKPGTGERYNTLRENQSLSIETTIKNKDGKEIPVELSASTIEFEGEVIIQSIIRDITERKNFEAELIKAKDKAEESSRVKSFFLAQMSHELRTPMVGILGYASLLAERLEDEELKNFSESMIRSGRRLMETLNSILDLSKIESENLELQPEVFYLDKAAETPVNLFSKAAAEKQLFLKLNVKENDLPVELDLKLFEQILNNLVNNAVKYTKHGGITVEIDRETIDNKAWGVIRVIDTGIGIPEESKKIIFEPFRQVSEGISRQFEGTGLGLTITKKYVDAMSGRISLESKIDEGSVFTVKFPLKVVNFI